MAQTTFAGELSQRGESIPVHVSFRLTLVEVEPEWPNEADLGMRLDLPDGSFLHFSAFFSKRGLVNAANTLARIATGQSKTACIYDVDYNLSLDIARVPGNEDRVVATGRFLDSEKDSHLAEQWQDVIERQPPPTYPTITLKGLLLKRSDMRVLAKLFQQFLEEVGRALPEQPPYG